MQAREWQVKEIVAVRSACFASSSAVVSHDENRRSEAGFIIFEKSFLRKRARTMQLENNLVLHATSSFNVGGRTGSEQAKQATEAEDASLTANTQAISISGSTY